MCICVYLLFVLALNFIQNLFLYESIFTCIFKFFPLSFSGCRNGAIHHHDVRMPDHHVATLSRHSQEVCGLKWSPDGKYLASGGNDNLLLIWDASVNTISNSNTPLYTFNQHQAAVKVGSLCNLFLCPGKLLFCNLVPRVFWLFGQ